VLAGLLCAVAAAFCYGVGSVLQAVAARSTAAEAGLDPRLLVRLLRSWRYVVGVALDGLGFVLSLVAVQSMPLFVVQSIVASFLAIAAVLGAVFLKMPLSRTDRVALVVVVVGLVLVAASAADESTRPVSPTGGWILLGVVVVLCGVAVPLARVPGARGAALLGGIAGLAFGATSVAARMIPSDLVLSELVSDLGALATSPATYALALAGGLALLTYSTALQRGSVTQATAPLVVGETIAPALVGVLALGDHSRPGWAGVAVAGFALAVGGAVALSRHGELEA
jgi:drug/metabolite transporter (DMT)-like permease